jgi:ADP-ribosyl-[dinitrogen reductase] hydrolase
MRIAIEDRAKGAMLGLAIGDAMGAPVEFRARGKFAPVTGFRDGGPFKLKAGQWTDDTAMALCLAQSLIDCNGMDAKDQMDKYLRWANDGYMACTDRSVGIGQTVLRSLSRYYKTNEPYQGDSNPKFSGNGCIMRLAPVPIYYHNDSKAAMLESINSARTTHGSPQTLQCSAYFGGLIWAALNGYTKEQMLQPYFSPCSEFDFNHLHDDVERVFKGSYQNMADEDLNPTGYVVDSLEVALWGFFHFDNFEEGLLAVLNLGGDADTIGAIYGQLAGAMYGSNDLRDNLTDNVCWGNSIVEVTSKLVSDI